MPIYDAYGRPVIHELLTRPQANPTLAGIRNIYSSVYPDINLLPERLVGILRQADFGDAFLQCELFEAIEEKDNLYLGVLNKRKGAVSGLEITVTPASKDKADVMRADFVREVLLDESALNLSDHLFDIMDAIGKGFSATEIEWSTERTVSGRLAWIPIDLKWRDPRWFQFDWISGQQVLVRSLRNEQLLSGGDERLFNQTLELTKIPGGAHLGGTWAWNSFAEEIGIQPLTAPLAPYKFITHFGRAKSGLPIRSGLTRVIAWSYLFKILAMKDFSIFVQRYGQPVRVGKYPAGATDEDKNALLAATVSIGADMSGIIPDSTTIEFLTDGNVSSQTNLFVDYLNWLNTQIEIVVLGSTLGTEVRNQGSRAAAQTHRDVERDIMQSDARRLDATLNRDLVRPIVDLNLGAPSNGRYPKLRLGIPDDVDSSIFVENVTKLAAAGVKIPQKPVLEKLHIPPAEPGDDLMTPPQRVTERTDLGEGDEKPGKPGAGGGAPGIRGDAPKEGKPDELDEDPGPLQYPPAAHATRPRSDHPTVNPDEFAERLREQWQEVMDPMVAAVLKDIRQATSYEDLQRRINSAASRMNPKQYRELMHRALFAAKMAGRLGARLE